MSAQRRRSQVGVAVLLAGVALALTPAPPALGVVVVVVAVVLVAGGGAARA